MKGRLFFGALILLMINIQLVSANVPQVTNLEVTVETDGRVLTVTVNHLSPTSVHYIDKLEVDVGGSVQTIELSPQDSNTFTETVSIASTGDVQVRAHCTVHGWSSWAVLGGGQGTQSNGVPGFPLLSLFLGAMYYVFVKSEHHPHE